MSRQLQRGAPVIVDHLKPNTGLPSQYREGVHVGAEGELAMPVMRNWERSIPNSHYVKYFCDGKYRAHDDDELRVKQETEVLLSA